MYAFPNKRRAVKKFVAMKLWMARSERGLLTMHYVKPTYKDNFGWNHVWAILDSKEFPEVTFENSPQQVEIKLVKEG